jgi:hypothetical protein
MDFFRKIQFLKKLEQLMHYCFLNNFETKMYKMIII